MSGFGRGGPRGGGRGGSRFQRSDPSAPRVASEVQIFVENLPLDAKIPALVQLFSEAGRVKVDRISRTPRVWLYHDKSTGRPTGECTVTFCNHESQAAALQMFNGKNYEGCTLKVTPSIVKAHMARAPPPMPSRGGRGRGRGGGGGKMTNANMEALGSRGFRPDNSSGFSGSFGQDYYQQDMGLGGIYGAASYGQYSQSQDSYEVSPYSQPGSSYDMSGASYSEPSGNEGQFKRFGASRFAPY